MAKDKKQSVKTSDKKEESKVAQVKTIKKDSKAIKKSTKTEKDGDRKKKRMTSRFNKLRLKGGSGHGVVYVGHLPRGFAEKEIKKFFSQFGDIQKIRVARSKKTGRPKGYCFLDF